MTNRLSLLLTLGVMMAGCGFQDHRDCPVCNLVKVDAMQQRIDRLAADSARPWWVVAPCGDTLWGHGSMPDSMGAGMNPDSSYEAARQHLLEIIAWNEKRYAYPWECPCDTAKEGR